MKTKLKLAIQKSGRLTEKSLQLLSECGISISNGSRSLIASAQSFPLEVLFLRDDDIPEYVENGVADIGILGQNVVLEKEKSVQEIRQLGFAKCRLSLAVRRENNYTNISDLNGKKIATTYPKILAQYLAENGVNAEIETISGSVEIAPSIGLADAVCDIVSTGSTLLMNGLKEVEKVISSEAVLIANDSLSQEKQELLNRLLFRIDAVKTAKNNKYILLNAPNDKLEILSNLLPGMDSPTIMPLAKEGWSSLHSVVPENQFWEIIDELKANGAQGILVTPIEKMIV
tara:strand:+ start:612 stop:1472 length:861 start_codon:yes stop_codon:yes gene_type:complete